MQYIRKKQGWSNGSLLLILFFSFIVKDCLMPVNSRALIGIKKGDVPKKILLADPDGNAVDLSGHFGKNPVIIVFWELAMDNAFLDYSLEELRYLNRIYEKYHNEKGLEVFAVYTPEDDKDIPEQEMSTVRNLIASNKIKFPVLIDRGFEFFREYGIIALPSTIMVNKAGKIQYIYPSFPLSGRPVFSEYVRDLIGIAPVEGKKEGVKKRGPDSNAQRLYRYALQMYKKGLLEQALSPLKKSLEIDPDNSWFHNLQGIIQWKKGNSSLSVEEFARAIKLDKKNIAAHLNYTVLLIEEEKYDKAEKILISLPPSKDDYKLTAHYLLGYVHEKSNEIDKAISELEIAYNLLEKGSSANDESDPRTFSFRISILHDLSLLYNRKGKKKKALALLHQAFHYSRGIEGAPLREHLHQNRHLMIYD